MTERSTSTNTTSAGAGEEFDAAKNVFDALKDLAKDRQERVLRWVAETLGILPHLSPPSTLAAPASAVIASPAQPAVPPSQPSVDIASFIDSKKPRTDIQFVTTVAYFYRFEALDAERRQTINAKVAQDATRLVKRERLTDPLSTLNNAQRQGYLNRRAKGEFEISTVGENLVIRTLPATNEITQPRGARRKAKSVVKRTNRRR